ncbi:MAG TPA: vanadium-dependent haloperoxidase [Saprospiraceae bacterium]|nr:vanadium-dependent haloperoxidase [Saprospiraceae bacterium]
MNNLKFKKPIYLLLCFLIVGLISSCRKDEVPVSSVNRVKDIASTDVINDWNTAISKVEFGYGEYRPCPIATVLAYTGLANYETAIPGMPDYLSLATNYPGLSLPNFNKNQEINWPIAINASTAYMYKQFFPKDVSKLATTETALLTKYSANVSKAIIDASTAWGQSVATAVYNYSKSDIVTFDGYLNLYPAYTVKTGDGYWVPTPPDFTVGKFPQWGKGRTFAISEADKQIPAPIPYSTDKNSLYYGQAIETYNRSINGNDEDKWIAEFWSDDLSKISFSPVPRWMLIASQAYIVSSCNLEKAVVTNTKLGLALNDAAIACWDQKYKWQVERPVTFIRKFIDPNYKTFLTANGVTPNFPTYPSGHGTFGSAAAEVLTYELGSDFAMTDRCHEGETAFNGTPRSFFNFYDMAYENAESRIPLGVHFRMDAKEALSLGYRIGRKVNELPFGK